MKPEVTVASRRKLWIGGSVGAGLLLATILLLCRTSEPNPERQVQKLIKSLKNPRKAYDAARALVLEGPLAVPGLTEALKDEDPNVRYEAAYILGQVGWHTAVPIAELAKLADDVSPEVRHVAVRSLGTIGPSAATSTNTLLRKLHDPDLKVVQSSAEALWRISKNTQDTVPVFAALLDQAEPNDRDHLLSILTQMGTNALPAVPMIKQLNKIRYSDTRLLCARALWVISKDAESVLQIVVPLVSEGRSRVMGLELLAEMGIQARPAKEVVAGFLNDPNPRVRKRAQHTLEKIEGRS